MQVCRCAGGVRHNSGCKESSAMHVRMLWLCRHVPRATSAGCTGGVGGDSGCKHVCMCGCCGGADMCPKPLSVQLCACAGGDGYASGCDNTCLSVGSYNISILAYTHYKPRKG
eukprot:scaffold286090_cov19-Tisochrysis_lutea.AAC.1